MPTQTIQKQIKEALKEFENNLHENKLVEEDKYSPYFDTAHVRVQELLSMFSEHLFTIATKSAEESFNKGVDSGKIKERKQLVKTISETVNMQLHEMSEDWDKLVFDMIKRSIPKESNQ